MNTTEVMAPTLLSTTTRGAFYDAAVLALDRLPRGGSGRLIIDLSGTTRVDSSGLATLVLIQVRAAERNHAVALRGVSDEIRFLLVMTRLEDRFDIEPGV